MVKVITYGTYELLHYGHIKLLERAKGLGDYLIVGVTSDDFDKTGRGVEKRELDAKTSYDHPPGADNIRQYRKNTQKTRLFLREKPCFFV